MNELDPHLERFGGELQTALGRRIASRRRRRRVGAATAAALLAFSTAAVASDDVGLQTFGLDPAQFELLGGDRVGEDAEYIYVRTRDGYTNVFVHTKDAGMDRYDAFRLHQRTVRAAATASGTQAGSEPGPDCSAAQLTRAEVVALETLAASFGPGTIVPNRASPPAHASSEAAVDEAVQTAFSGEQCSGLDYAGEIALLVYTGLEPIADLMPGARASAREKAGG